MQSWKAPLFPFSSSASHCSAAPSHPLQQWGLLQWCKARALTWSAPRSHQVFRLRGGASHSLYPSGQNSLVFGLPALTGSLGVLIVLVAHLQMKSWASTGGVACEHWPCRIRKCLPVEGHHHWFLSSWSLFPSKTQEPDQCWIRVGGSL